MMDLNTVLFMLVVVLVAGYGVLDGFDLGVGILSLFARSQQERDQYVVAIEPVWDGNEVWLLATADVLFGAFPLAFVTVFSGFYLALMLLLVALVSRAVSIQFRLMHPALLWTSFWDLLFGVGSLAMAFILGVAVGNLLAGVPLGPGFVWQGNFPALLSPYALLIGAVTCALFTLHGSLYLRMKCTGKLAERLGRIAMETYFVFLGLYVSATAVTVHISPFLFKKSGSLLFQLLAVLLVIALVSIPVSILAGWTFPAFLASSATILLMTLVTAFSAHPLLVPSNLAPDYSLTIYNAAATHGTLELMLAVALVGMPIMLCYTFFVYRVFRGHSHTPESRAAGDAPAPTE